MVDERVYLLSLFAAGLHLKHTTEKVMEDHQQHFSLDQPVSVTQVWKKIPLRFRADVRHSTYKAAGPAPNMIFMEMLDKPEDPHPEQTDGTTK